MLGIHDLWLFIAAGLLLNVSPGPDTAYIIGRTVQLGWRGGAMAALGIGAGCLVHVFGAAIGLSALLAASTSAFIAVKIIGVVYLLYTGIRMIMAEPSQRSADTATPAATFRAVFLQGALTNVLNPKVALFFLAFLPQFVDGNAPSKPLAFVLLGSVFVLNGTLWCLAVAAFAAKAAGRIRRSDRVQVWANRILGSFFVGLGCRLALAETR